MAYLIADISHWDVVDYKILAQHLQGVIIKAGQGQAENRKFRVHVAGCENVGLPYGIYYWLEPNRDPIQQANHALELANSVRTKFIAMDFEQWWQYYDEYVALLQGKLSADQVRKIPAKQIDSAGKAFMQKIASFYKAVFYSSPGFVSTWCPTVQSWMIKYHEWMARYIITKRITVTWEGLEYYIPKTQSLFFGHLPEIWQWTGDKITLPGTASPLDLNVWQTGVFEDLFGPAQPPVPLPYVEYKLQSWVYGLNVRSGPGTQYPVIRVLTPGCEILLEKGQTTTWVKLYGENAYIHSGYIEPA